MPKIYLSPSTQEYNPYVTGNGSEEYFMNLVADAMEPYLLANGIQFSRNTPDMTAASSFARQTAGTTTFTWLCTPTPPAPAARGRTGGSSPFITPPAGTAAGGRRSSPGICRRFTPCRSGW